MTFTVASFQTATESKQSSTNDGRDVVTVPTYTGDHYVPSKSEGKLENRLNDATARPNQYRRSAKYAVDHSSSSTI